MLKLNLLLTLSLCFAASIPALAADIASGDRSAGFEGKLGLQLYSLRAQFAKDVPGTLEKVHDMGFTNIETAGTYGLSPEKFAAELKSHGLRAISGHFPFERFRDEIDGIIRDAKALGLKYAGCAG